MHVYMYQRRAVLLWLLNAQVLGWLGVGFVVCLYVCMCVCIGGGCQIRCRVCMYACVCVAAEGVRCVVIFVCMRVCMYRRRAVLRWPLDAQIFGVKGWVLGVEGVCKYVRMHVCVSWARTLLLLLLNA